ncbi:MAG TPA: thioredoxin domain-containing protein [Allosphingosinicella sp.]|nr:thioredoxin domain-containing protein [Allosphingosinicella sp.]
MKAALSVGTMALTIALAGCNGSGNTTATAQNEAPLEQIAAPNNGDWRTTISQTPEGGYRMGNPNAPVKLVEYGSLTCPHCKQFSDEATATLRDTYVRSGQVSWEFRNFLLGGPDLALSLLVRCQPPAAFFTTIEDVYTRQHEFIDAIDQQESTRISALPPEQQLEPLARAMDLDTYFARRGVPEARFAQCIGDAGQIQALTDRTQRAAAEEGVPGTPSFFINGTRVEAGLWNDLEPLLRTALGR